MTDLLRFDFAASLWHYPGPAAWHFITLPEDVAGQIKFFSGQRKGFGSVRITAKIGETSWKTSLFPDSKSKSYLLPVKAAVRKAEGLSVGQNCRVRISFEP